MSGFNVAGCLEDDEAGSLLTIVDDSCKLKAVEMKCMNTS
jgi:hypothetical protein